MGNVSQDCSLTFRERSSKDKASFLPVRRQRHRSISELFHQNKNPLGFKHGQFTAVTPQCLKNGRPVSWAGRLQLELASQAIFRLALAVTQYVRLR